ncbi:hypothetical protein [Clostridium sp. ZBS18]|uniref:hypothetical protein n=1 Tax=Clostridium sp. ZBS18 TaxID=2949967 RepID=UPI00207B0BA2|nr:hypothetical protein [Clostridium sp. ZBS18]
MGVIILLIIVVIIIYKIYPYDEKVEKIDMLTRDNMDFFSKKGYNYIKNGFFVHYKGGIRNLSVNSSVIVDLLQEGIAFNKDKKIILFKNINNIILENETQIQQQISLGKMLIFGALAFGMERKNKEINNEYIVLKVEDEDGEYSVLLQSNDQKDNQKNYDKLIDLKEYTN